MEDKCLFVSSRGLLKSCDVYNNKINSSDVHLDLDKYLSIKKNDIVYVCNSAIQNFFKNIFPLIKEPFVLVSGDSDVSTPFEGFESYINEDKLIVWFSQNLTISHPKIKNLPIGLDYHTISKPDEVHPWGQGMLPVEQENLLIQIKNISPDLFNRKFACYINFHFPYWDINKRGDRQECLNKIDKTICWLEPNYLQRYDTWKHMSQFVFVICPFGGGYDTHRLWEALILDCIPIIKTSGLDPLLEDMNVCIVQDWSQVNQEFLLNYIKNIKHRNYNKLRLEYWIDLIKSFRIA
jgi:hypothetical protein